MFEQTGTSPIAIGRRWRFKVQGLDCQNEVRLLREALIPLVGDERFLSFQPKLGLLDVDVASMAWTAVTKSRCSSANSVRS